MQHLQVLMVSDAPEFLTELAGLDKSMRDCLVTGGEVGPPTEDLRIAAFVSAVVKTQQQRRVDPKKRLSDILKHEARMSITAGSGTLASQGTYSFNHSPSTCGMNSHAWAFELTRNFLPSRHSVHRTLRGAP